MDHMDKIIIPVKKPRNPLVRQALFRSAGRFDTGNRRQAAKRDLSRELRSL